MSQQQPDKKYIREKGFAFAPRGHGIGGSAGLHLTSGFPYCPLPLRLDTYEGCGHGCAYCFANRVGFCKEPTPHNAVKAVTAFIQGKRVAPLRWIDWRLPIHWGGMSDPFQPVEVTCGVSFKLLRVFAETGYPVVISTKGALLASRRYLDVLKRAHAVVQISMVSPELDPLESGAPPYAERLRMLECLSAHVQRVLVRIQPFSPPLRDSVISRLSALRDAGCYGVIVEGWKSGAKAPGLYKRGGYYAYPDAVLRRLLLDVRDAAHNCGLRFYSGENRLRELGDDLCCCGIDGLEGFQPAYYNVLARLRGFAELPRRGQVEAPAGGSVIDVLFKAYRSRIPKTTSYMEAVNIAATWPDMQRRFLPTDAGGEQLDLFDGDGRTYELPQ